MTTYPRTFAVSQRGFANEVSYILIENAQQAGVIEKFYEDLSDKTPGAWTRWRDAPCGRIPQSYADWHWEEIGIWAERGVKV